MQLKLLMNGNPITLAKLINPSATLISINDKGIESKIEFKNLILSDERDLPIEFIFPLKATSL